MSVAQQKESSVYQQLLDQYYEEVKAVVQSVVRRTLFVIERYAQFRCNDLNDRGLKTEIRSSVIDMDEGVKLVVEFIPSRECILKAVKNVRFKRLIKQYEKELRRMERRSKRGRS